MSVLKKTHKSFSMNLQKLEVEQMALAICGVCNVEVGGYVVLCSALTS